MVIRTFLKDHPSGVWHWSVATEPDHQNGDWQYVVMYSGWCGTLLGAWWRATRRKRTLHRDSRNGRSVQPNPALGEAP